MPARLIARPSAVAAALLLAVGLLLAHADAGAVPARAADARPLAGAAVESRLVDMVNADRAAAGLAPLRLDVRLVAASRSWSRSMAARGRLGHERDRGVPPGVVADAENVAMVGVGSDPAAALHRLLMGSAPHRANVLSGRYTDLGVGVVTAGGRAYLTQRFTAGGPARVAPAVIGLAQLAEATFGTHGARHAVLARDDVFADALAAGPLAGGEGPILLTPPGPALHPRVATALSRVLPAGARVWLVGGPAAVSEEVAHELAAAGYDVRRLEGPSRVETAAVVSGQVAGGREAAGGTVVVATAGDWPDAVSGGAYGARVGAPILLTHRDAVPDATARALGELRPARVVVLGGAGAVADATVAALGAERVGGRTRAATSAAVASSLWGHRDVAPRRWVATPAGAEGWTWAVGAAPSAARAGAPVLLAGAVPDPDVTTYLRSLRGGPSEVLTVGPVPAGTAAALRALVP